MRFELISLALVLLEVVEDVEAEDMEAEVMEVAEDMVLVVEEVMVVEEATEVVAALMVDPGVVVVVAAASATHFRKEIVDTEISADFHMKVVVVVGVKAMLEGHVVVVGGTAVEAPVVIMEVEVMEVAMVEVEVVAEAATQMVGVTAEEVTEVAAPVDINSRKFYQIVSFPWIALSVLCFKGFIGNHDQ